MSVTINGTNGLVFNDNSTQTTAATGFGFKNRIINGNMTINQRAVTSVAAGSEVYTLDRWIVANYFSSGAISVAQSSDAPAGFTNSLLVTNGTGEALSAGDFGCVRQKIEGFNVADFAWGTASATPITISFWVKSSITGNYSVGLINGSLNRANRSVVTINAANTWEQKSVTFTGDTSGTWTTNNGIGLYVDVLMVAGSNQYAAANTWTSNTLEGVSGASATWITSTNATFYITGVQLEKGSTATSFDYRPYGTELALCQRYYQKSYNIGVAPGAADTAGQFNHNFLNLGNFGNVVQRFGIAMRSSPTMTVYDGVTGASGTIRYWNGSAETTRTTNFALSASDQQLNMADDTFNHTNIIFQWTASAEL